LAPFAWGQVSESTTTTTTTEGGGTITGFTPGSAIVLKESSGPRHCRFWKNVTDVTRSGKVLEEDTIKARIKVRLPVHMLNLACFDRAFSAWFSKVEREGAVAHRPGRTVALA
jgi:hypothetical protein